ncbi:MAG: glycosyltransferase [Cyanobacteria bacterium P01_E01_bin.6]
MISLVSTVLNDKQGLELFFNHMEAQTLRPDEIVIVDGGSTDGTWEFLQKYSNEGAIALKCFQELGCNVARGRNLAIKHASYDVIASTDIGCKWEAKWLEELTRPLFKETSLEAVMGSWQVHWKDLKSDWARVDYLLNNELRFLATPQSHASSRSIAYRKTLWKRIGGYPEDLTLAGDDMVFALLLHKATNKVDCAPIPRCYWERPIKLKSFCKEAQRNFLGGGEAGIWIEYGIWAGGRLFLELLLLILGFLTLIFSFYAGISIILLIFASISVGFRIFDIKNYISKERENIPKNFFLKSIVFLYSVKFYSLIGYWSGFLNGKLKSQDCRNRLAHS